MTVHLVTFHDDQMTRAARLATESADRNGVSECWIWTPESVAQLPIAKEHSAVFRQPTNPARAWSHWAFKPAIILEELNAVKRINPASYIVYADAGVEFINNVSHIIDRMDQDIFLFGNNWEHAHWCKRDVVEAVWPISQRGRILREPGPIVDVYLGSDTHTTKIHVDELAWERFHKQCQASMIFFRVSDYSRQFVAEWLKWCLHRIRFSEGVCTDEWRYLIDDSPSIAPNHPEFRENRHDQAILTTLAYREGLRLHYWPAIYNRGSSPEFVYEKLPEYVGDDYPILFNHHRKRNHEWENAA